MTVNEIINVLDAYNRGEEIEEKMRDHDGPWYPIDKEHPIWNFGGFDFRVKPDKKRPYSSDKEMTDDYCYRAQIIKSNIEYPFIWVKLKLYDISSLVIQFYDNGVVLINPKTDNKLMSVSYKELAKDYTYLDGSYIGIEN